MIRMHLRAQVPNEGARKLAWWIGRQCAGCLARARHATRLDETTLQRLLDGELIPGAPLVAQIQQRTDPAIGRRDWQRDAQGGWFDKPAAPGALGRRLAA